MLVILHQHIYQTQIDDGNNGVLFCFTALKSDCRMRILSSEQLTAALKVTSAYTIVSMTAIFDISGVIPIGLQVSERRRV